MSPKKIALVAGREFMAAVTNKGFMIGLLIMPAMFAVLFALMPRLMTTQRRPSSAATWRSSIPPARIAPALRETITPGCDPRPARTEHGARAERDRRSAGSDGDERAPAPAR